MIDYELIIEYPIGMITVLLGVLTIKIIEAVIQKSKLKAANSNGKNPIEDGPIRE